MTTLANVSGRLTIVVDDGAVDVEKASGGRFGPDPQAVYDDWDAFSTWVGGATLTADQATPEPSSIGTPLPSPRQIIGVGLSYHDHIAHAGLTPPTTPGFFAKFVSSLTGPFADISVPGDKVSTEVELALVVGRGGYRIPVGEAVDHLAGVTIAQDLTDPESSVQVLRHDGSTGARYIDPGKSHPGFVPVGPYVHTLDTAGDLADLTIELDIDDRPVQRGNSRDLVFPIADLVSQVSHHVALLPGDIILTGSADRLEGTHAITLAPGQTVRARVGSLGEQRTTIVEAA